MFAATSLSLSTCSDQALAKQLTACCDCTAPAQLVASATTIVVAASLRASSIGPDTATDCCSLAVASATDSIRSFSSTRPVALQSAASDLNFAAEFEFAVARFRLAVSSSFEVTQLCAQLLIVAHFGQVAVHIHVDSELMLKQFAF